MFLVVKSGGISDEAHLAETTHQLRVMWLLFDFHIKNNRRKKKQKNNDNNNNNALETTQENETPPSQRLSFSINSCSDKNNALNLSRASRNVARLLSRNYGANILLTLTR